MTIAAFAAPWPQHGAACEFIRSDAEIAKLTLRSRSVLEEDMPISAEAELDDHRVACDAQAALRALWDSRFTKGK